MNTYSLCNDETCPQKDNCSRYNTQAEVVQGYPVDFNYLCVSRNYEKLIKKNNIVDNTKDNIVNNTTDNNSDSANNNSDSANNAPTEAQKQE